MRRSRHLEAAWGVAAVGIIRSRQGTIPGRRLLAPPPSHGRRPLHCDLGRARFVLGRHANASWSASLYAAYASHASHASHTSHTFAHLRTPSHASLRPPEPVRLAVPSEPKQSVVQHHEAAPNPPGTVACSHIPVQYTCARPFVHNTAHHLPPPRRPTCVLRGMSNRQYRVNNP